MGGISTKEEIIARLDVLDKEEIYINKQLRELQLELNGIVPVKDRVKVKKEYFDNISMGELSKYQENQDNNKINNNEREGIKDNENLEDLEIEEEDEEEDKHKKNKEKKVLFDIDNRKAKQNKKRKKKWINFLSKSPKTF